MREILFRGKTEAGEWVYGGIGCQEGDEVAIIGALDKYQSLYDLGIKSSYVIPETVGQFTGVTDKNGKKIFEGDIIEDKYDVYAIWFGKHNIGCCGCCYQSHQSVGFYISDKDGGKPLSDEHAWEDWCVVGNIFDNPELLECQD